MGRRPKNGNTLPSRFSVKYLDDADLRTSGIKEFRRRLLELQEAAAADSPQKRLLCERANFIAAKLQSMEVDALQGRDINENSYTCMVNTLTGLLKTLGLEAEESGGVIDLDNYLKRSKESSK